MKRSDDPRHLQRKVIVKNLYATELNRSTIPSLTNLIVSELQVHISILLYDLGMYYTFLMHISLLLQ